MVNNNLIRYIAKQTFLGRNLEEKMFPNQYLRQRNMNHYIIHHII